MRSGGVQKWFQGARLARRVVPAGLLAGALLALMVPAAGADDHTANQWSIVRSVDGHLRIERGIGASIAAMDASLGRSADAVLSTEQDTPVHSLGDPLRANQWALNRVNFESAWSATRG